MAFTITQGPIVNSAAYPTGYSVAVEVPACTAGRVVIASVHWYSDSDFTVTSVTCSGESDLNARTVAVVDDGSAHNFIQLFDSGALSTSGSKTLTATLSGASGNSAIRIHAFELNGGDPADLFEVGASTNGDSALPSVNISPVTANTFVFGVCGGPYFAMTATPGAGYTELYQPDDNNVFAGWGLGEYDLDAGAGGVKTVNATMDSSDFWMIVAAAYNPGVEVPDEEPIAATRLTKMLMTHQRYLRVARS